MLNLLKILYYTCYLALYGVVPCLQVGGREEYVPEVHDMEQRAVQIAQRCLQSVKKIQSN
jgi:hypothetical protein